MVGCPVQSAVPGDSSSAPNAWDGGAPEVVVGDGRGGASSDPRSPDGRTAPARLRLYLTDAPAAFDAVWVTIRHVEAAVGGEGEGGWIPLTHRAQRFDLLTLRNDVTALLGDTGLPAGEYSQLRVFVSDPTVVVDGQEHALTIPSADQTGIKVEFGAKFQGGTAYAVVLDFDAEKSIVRAGGRFLMKPVIHVKRVRTLDEEEGDHPGESSDADAGVWDDDSSAVDEADDDSESDEADDDSDGGVIE
jgi:hypothetical protein